jgi:hypothetical protein
MLRFCALLTLVALLGQARARADEAPPVVVDETDFALYLRLRETIVLADARSMKADPAKRVALQTEKARLLAASDWTVERYMAVEATLVATAKLLDRTDPQASAALTKLSPVTRATAEQHLYEIRGVERVYETARAQAAHEVAKPRKSADLKEKRR